MSIWDVFNKLSVKQQTGKIENIIVGLGNPEYNMKKFPA